MKFLTVILVALLSNFAFAEEVSVRFGLLKITERVGADSYRFGFLKEADSVPLLTLKQGGIYGVEYRAPESHKYIVQVKAVIPPNVQESGGNLLSIKKENERTVMVFKPRALQGTSVEPFLFTVGDPAGQYTLEISVNGKPHKTITYQTYVPVAH